MSIAVTAVLQPTSKIRCIFDRLAPFGLEVRIFVTKHSICSASTCYCTLNGLSYYILLC